MIRININDIKDVEKTPDDIWKAIFDKQNQLVIKYKDVEKMGDLLDTKERNIDTAKGQKFIKDFAWRVTEEITEALEAKNEGHNLHYLEEVTDALHFFVELCIIAGYTREDFDLVEMKIKDEFECIYYLGLACNCLKNKPWKQTQMLTDRPKFKCYIQIAFNKLVGIYYMNGLKNKDIYNLYFKKNMVNQFRIRSKY